VSAELHLKGKPAPDTYLKAAEMLGVQPRKAVVVEDALSGVQAGRNGKFGLVIGVDRQDDADALQENGADLVVTDLGDMLS
jgi:beta-phosphoglucomutase-like phosphatase (HAD superfamily)